MSNEEVCFHREGLRKAIALTPDVVVVVAILLGKKLVAEIEGGAGEEVIKIDDFFLFPVF